MGLLIFLAIYTFLLLAFMPAVKIAKAQAWCQLQVKKMKDKLDS
jgi:hypothetical protein